MINMNNDTIQNLNNLIAIQKIINENNFSLMIQNQMNQELFLQKKRFLENQNLNYNINENYPNSINLGIQNNNDILKNEYHFNIEQNKNLSSQIISPYCSYCYNNCCNLKVLNYLIPGNKDNKLENIFIKSNIINNVYNNLNGNHNNNFFNNYFNIENSKENINDNIDNNLNSIDSSNSTYLSSNKAFKKKNYFNITHIKTEKPKKKIRKKSICQSENNNEIKVLKNNKVVYVNTFLLNSYTSSKNIKKLNKIAFIGRNKRSSRFRGVSKNGNQWQVLIMINKNKSYIGSYPYEELAARVYDVLALKNRGIKARTNFIYNSKQIQRICELDIDVKSKNIDNIISHLIE